MAAVRHGLSTDGEFIPSAISGGLDDSPIWLQTPKACITPTHPVIMTFSSLEKAKGFRETDTDMGEEKPAKMADGTETGMYSFERLAGCTERVEQILLTSFCGAHHFQPMDIHRVGYLGYSKHNFHEHWFLANTITEDGVSGGGGGNISQPFSLRFFFP